MKQRLVAELKIHDAPVAWTEQGRRLIAQWLRDQAREVEQNAHRMAKGFSSSYRIPTDESD